MLVHSSTYPLRRKPAFLPMVIKLVTCLDCFGKFIETLQYPWGLGTQSRLLGATGSSAGVTPTGSWGPKGPVSLSILTALLLVTVQLVMPMAVPCQWHCQICSLGCQAALAAAKPVCLSCRLGLLIQANFLPKFCHFQSSLVTAQLAWSGRIGDSTAKFVWITSAVVSGLYSLKKIEEHQ